MHLPSIRCSPNGVDQHVLFFFGYRWFVDLFYLSLSLREGVRKNKREGRKETMHVSERLVPTSFCSLKILSSLPSRHLHRSHVRNLNPSSYVDPIRDDEIERGRERGPSTLEIVRFSFVLAHVSPRVAVGWGHVGWGSTWKTYRRWGHGLAGTGVGW